MGEALISRAGGGSESESPIPIVNGYHTIIATIRLPDGDLLTNYPVICNDNGAIYNYNTNERGQVMFTCNSGMANIFVNNYNTANGVQYIDFASVWNNYSAQIGFGSRQNINLTSRSSGTIIDFTSSKLFTVSQNRNANINIVGGGGGGAGRWEGGGAAANINNYSNVKLIKNNVYNFIAGTGGSGASSSTGGNGGAGGTSYIVNTSMSAVGGAGGSSGNVYGQLGNGVRASGTSGVNGGDSPVSFAGGGGGSGGSSGGSRGYGGSPYGGDSAWFITFGSYGSASPGQRGGGGGGGQSGERSGASGGAGMIRITI